METNEHGSMDLTTGEHKPGAENTSTHEEDGRNANGMLLPRPIGANRKREGKERSDRESRLHADREQDREREYREHREKRGARESGGNLEEEESRDRYEGVDGRGSHGSPEGREGVTGRLAHDGYENREDHEENEENEEHEEHEEHESRGNRMRHKDSEDDEHEERERHRESGDRNRREEREARPAEKSEEKGEPGAFNVGNLEELKPEDRIPDDIDEWIEELKVKSGLDASFDVQMRQMTFGDKRTGFLFLSCFTKDASLTEIIKRLSQLDPESLRLGQSALKSFFEFYLPAIQVTVTSSMSKLIEEVMIGNTAFYVDGEATALIIDAKQFPSRTPDEPVLEKVVRGSKDGFTETLLMNVALVRRRLRDPHLRFEIVKVGKRTQTDVAIGYIEDIADAKLVESLRDKIQAVNIDGLPLADKQLEEMTVKTDWNPFPLVRYSERPDVVASHLMNGSVTVIVDTSPSVIVLPTTFFDLVQHAEENRQNPFIGTYLRWVRFFGVLSSIFLLPLWFLFAENPELRPHWLWFLGADKTGDLPLVIQFLMVEVGVDLMRLAAVHTPSPLVTAMSLVSAILVGDIAVKTGLFINEVILYMAVAAIGMFATPSYELGLANRIVRLVLLISAFAFQAPGFLGAATIIFIFLALTRSFNSPYLWPFIPFNAKAMLAVLLRRPLPKNMYRPSINRTKQNRKQPMESGEEEGAEEGAKESESRG